MISSWKNLRLDNIVFTSGENSTHNFPDHFHEEYTLGVSVTGIQRFNLLDKSYLVEPFSIFMIRPEQMHAHHPVADLGWSFKSLYLSPDLMKYLIQSSGFNPAKSFQPIIPDKGLFNQYLQLHENKGSLTEKDLVLFLQALSYKSTDDTTTAINVHSDKIADIKYHLAANTNQKLNLDSISRKFKLDKFQLIRQFKKQTGVTPNTYLTILRIEKARKLMHLHLPIVEAALEAGFYDQSHFHHSFLYYTGLTPGNFYKQL